LAKRNAIFFVGSGLASATTGLLAYGILPLGKSHPVLHGWQWMQIIEGCMAIFVSILFILFLPASPFNPRPMFLPIRYFNEKDQQILVARVLNDDKAKATSAKKITVKEVVSTLADWRKYPHLLLATAVISQTAAIGTYSPTLIRSFKFDSE
jgi:MFS family permease